MSTTTPDAPATGRRVTPTARLVLRADADRDQWLAARQRGIGSSDIPQMLGLSAYGTPRNLYHSKRGELPPERPEDVGDPAHFGTIHEEPNAREWARRNRTALQRVGLVAHVDHPWMMCTLDRRVLECPHATGQREMCALECKSRNAHVAPKWRTGVPDDVLAQVLWQIAVTGYSHIHTWCVLGGNDPRAYTIHRADHEGTIADITAAARAFWHEHVLAGVPPKRDYEQPGAELRLIGLLDEMESCRGEGPNSVVHLDRDPQVLNLIDEYEAARLEADAAERRKEVAKLKLIEKLDGAELAVIDGHMAYEWATVTRTQLKTRALRDAHPALFAEFAEEKTHRTLRIAKSLRHEKDA